jgi:hypothetical protein
MRLAGHGFQIDLPRGWDGRIWKDPLGEPTLHAANFPLPTADGDFGLRALAVMPDTGAFIALTEYEPAQAGHGLYEQHGLPIPVSYGALSHAAMQRMRPRRQGAQRFFTGAGRALCLYVVVGSDPTAGELLDRANAVLATLSIHPRAATQS